MSKSYCKTVTTPLFPWYLSLTITNVEIYVELLPFYTKELADTMAGMLELNILAVNVNLNY